MHIDTLKKDDYVIGQVFQSKFGLEEQPLFEYTGETEEVVRDYLENWIRLNSQESESDQVLDQKQEENKEENLGNSIKSIMPNFDDDDEEEIYTSIDEEEEEEEELEVEDILEDVGIDMPTMLQPSNGHNGNSTANEEAVDELPNKKIVIQSSTEWFSINNNELMKVLQNHEKVQELHSLLKDTSFNKLFERQLTLEDLPITPDPKQKKQTSTGVGKGRGRRKQGKSGRDHMIEQYSLADFISYLKECESSPKTQKTLCSELDAKFNAEVATNSAFMSQDLAVVRLLDELSAEYNDVQDWIDHDGFSWSDATAVMKAARNETDIHAVYLLLRARSNFEF